MAKKSKQGANVKGMLVTRKNMFTQEPAHAEKIDRNGPCPCGSGLKYKRCCAGSGGGWLKGIYEYVFGKK